MADETELLFHIISEDQERTFSFFKFNTVGDLKDEIHRGFKIHPQNQSIECWHRVPDSDTNTLISCCLQSECNFLVVSNSAETKSDQEITHFSNRSFSTETEISSTLSFRQYFAQCFNLDGISIRACSLEDAFSEAFSTSLEERKILILYMNTPGATFSQIFCRQLTNRNVQELLSNKFFLLCWDIGTDCYRPALVEALHKRSELRNLDRFVEEKICSAVVVVPVANSVKVLSVLKGKVKPEDVLQTLKQAEQFLIEENEAEAEVRMTSQKQTFGSKEYQQLMLNMLADRDYDSFDHDELDYLKEKIKYALFGPPQETEEDSERDRENERKRKEEKEKRRSTSGFFRKESEEEKMKREEEEKEENKRKERERLRQKQKEKTEFLFNAILEQNNSIAKWQDRVIISFIYVCLEPLPQEKAKRAKNDPGEYIPYNDFVPVPVFILRKCKNSENSCRIVIDDVGRVYKTWQNYLEENKLPESEMIFPRNGRYEVDDNGIVILDKQLTPSCDITNTVLQVTDIATAIGGIASGGAMIAAATIPAMAAAPLVVPIAGIAGAAAGIYSLTRSALSLHDRRSHSESIDFFDSPEARGAYINIVAGSLGFVGAGANMAVTQLAARGFNIGKGATAAMNTLNVVNLGAGGAGIVNSSYDVIRKWAVDNEAPTLLTVVQLSSSILFFGHAVYNYRSFASNIEESQANTLREYKDSLASNRQRKVFDKLLKETIRQNDGNTLRGQAEVISSLKNIDNKAEVFATLARSNKEMHKNNVRFAAANGQITLNGVSVDMSQFATMQKTQVITFLSQLPGKPNPAHPNVRQMSTYLQNQNSFRGLSHSEILSLALCLAKIFGDTDLTIKEKILNAVSELFNALFGNPLLVALDRMFPGHDKFFRVVNMVNNFFQTLVSEAEDQYRRWLETRDPQLEEPYYIRLSLDTAKRAAELFNIVTKVYFTATQGLTPYGLERLLTYFKAWFANEAYCFQERRDRRSRRRAHGEAAPRVICNVCGGHCYSTN